MRKEYKSWLYMKYDTKISEQKLDKHHTYYTHLNYFSNPLIRIKKISNNYYWNFYAKMYSKTSHKYIRPVYNPIY